MRHSPLAIGLLLAACLGLGHTESRTYIACDRPITCCVSYGTQTVTLQVQAR